MPNKHFLRLLLIFTIALISACSDDNYYTTGGLSATESGNILPGEYLSLSHDLQNGAFDAQIMVDGALYDYSEYPNLFSPAAKDPIEVWERDDVHELRDGVSMIELSDGNIAIVFALHDVSSSVATNKLEYRKLDKSGNILESSTIYSSTTPDTISENGLLYITELIGGEIAISTDISEEPVVILSNDQGVIIGTPLTFTFSDIYYRPHIAPADDDGFLLPYFVDATPLDILTLGHFNLDGNLESVITTVSNALDSIREIQVFRLTDGGILLIYMEEQGRGENPVIILMDADGTKRETIQVDSGIPTPKQGYSVAQAADETIYLSYEIQSSDNLMLMAFDPQGTIIIPLEIVTGVEPDFSAIGVFEDGEVMVAYSLEDSDALSFSVFSNEGRFLSKSLMTEAQTRDRAENLLPISNQEMWIQARPVDEFMSLDILPTSRNYLKLVNYSDTEVRLYNHGSNAVDAVIFGLGQ